ncbi:hypothetical protein GCM10027406_24600 [Leifsonia lichenia]
MTVGDGVLVRPASSLADLTPSDPQAASAATSPAATTTAAARRRRIPWRSECVSLPARSPLFSGDDG